MTAEVKESKEELKKRLTALAYQVTQEAGTERPFTGKYFFLINVQSGICINQFKKMFVL